MWHELTAAWVLRARRQVAARTGLQSQAARVGTNPRGIVRVGTDRAARPSHRRSPEHGAAPGPHRQSARMRSSPRMGAASTAGACGSRPRPPSYDCPRGHCSTSATWSSAPPLAGAAWRSRQPGGRSRSTRRDHRFSLQPPKPAPGRRRAAPARPRSAPRLRDDDPRDPSGRIVSRRTLALSAARNLFRAFERAERARDRQRRSREHGAAPRLAWAECSRSLQSVRLDYARCACVHRGGFERVARRCTHAGLLPLSRLRGH
jgi:hypothetical protein